MIYLSLASTAVQKGRFGRQTARRFSEVYRQSGPYNGYHYEMKEAVLTLVRLKQVKRSLGQDPIWRFSP
jgi:hypothetical protein